ncbi:hypothetical protein Tco_0524060 [Tanacetum coccineum]
MAALTDAVNAMLRHVKTSSPETVKAISESCVTCRRPHPYYECLAADGNTFNASTAATTYNQNQGYRPQGDPNYRASNQMGPPGFPPVQNNQNRFNQNQDSLMLLALADLGAIINLMPLSILKKLHTPRTYSNSKDLELAYRSTTKSHPNFRRCHSKSWKDSSTSGNPTPSLDPIISTYFPSLTPFEGGDFILEEIEACLTNDSIPSGIDDADFDPEGDLLLL